VSRFYLARFMGTSVQQIHKTYGHLLPDSLEQARELFDTFSSDGSAFGHGLDAISSRDGEI
jgi:hypothetical protein